MSLKNYKIITILLFLISCNLPAQAQTTWGNITNSLSKNVPILNNVLGTKLSCKGPYGKRAGLILNTKMNTLVWETIDDDTVNFPMRITTSNTQTIRAKYSIIEFFDHGVKYVPELKSTLDDFYGMINSLNSIHRDDAKRHLAGWSGEISLDRETGKARFTVGSLKWNSVVKPPGAKDIPADTEYYSCSLAKSKF